MSRGGARPDFTGTWTLVEQDSIPDLMAEMECPCMKIMAVKALTGMGKMTEESTIDPTDPKTGRFTFHITNKMATTSFSVVPEAGPQAVPGTPFGELRATPAWKPLRVGQSGRPAVGGMVLVTSFPYKGKEITFARHMEIDQQTRQELMVNEYFVDGRFMAVKTFVRKGEESKRKKGGGCC